MSVLEPRDAHPRYVPGVCFGRRAGGATGCGLPNWVYLTGAIFTAAASGGAFFGWPSIVSVLKSRGFFADMCPGGVTGCDAQSITFGDIYTYSALTSFCSPVVVGRFCDKFGPRASARLTTCIFIAGVILLMMADVTGPGTGGSGQKLLQPAFICFGFAASSQLAPLYNIAAIFKRQGLAFGLLNGAFDLGSVVFLIMAAMYDSGTSIRDIGIAYLCAPIFVLSLLGLFLWRPVPFTGLALPPAPAEVKEATVAVSEPAAAGGIELTVVPSAAAPAEAAVPASAEKSGSDSQAEAPAAGTTTLVVAEAAAPAPAPSEVAKPAAAAPPRRSLLPSCLRTRPYSDTETARLAALQTKGFFAQLLSTEWLTFAAFFCVCMLRYSCFLGNADPFLTQLGQDGKTYTQILSAILPCGCVLQFIVGPTIDNKGLRTAIPILWALGVALSIVCTIPSLELQVVGFLLFIAFRAFLFSTMSAYMARFFSFSAISSLIGAVILVGGLVALIQSPLLKWGVEARDFRGPNGLLLALMTASGAFPLWYHTVHGRKEAATAAAAKAAAALPAPPASSSSPAPPVLDAATTAVTVPPPSA